MSLKREALHLQITIGKRIKYEKVKKEKIKKPRRIKENPIFPEEEETDK